MNDVILVGFDHKEGTDIPVLIIGRKKPNDSIDVINAFQGDEAEELYKRLTTPKEERNG